MIPALIAARAFVARIPAWLWVALAFVAFLAGLVFLIDKGADKRASQAVEADRAIVSEEALRSALNANDVATTNEQPRIEAARVADKELTDEARKGTVDRVGPGTSAVLERMREQQAAGRR